MADLGATLKEKAGGIPIWVWAILGTGALSLFLIHKKQTTSSTQAAANQTSTNLGTASQLQDFFAKAFPMPYMGGDTYINQTVSAPASPVTVNLPGPSPSPTPVPVPLPINVPPILPQPGPVGIAPGVPNPPPYHVGPLADLNPYVYRVQGGDSWSAIAQKFGLTVDNLKNFNMGSGFGTAGRPASTIQILRQRGNTLYRNEEIDIPHKGTVYSGTGGA